jgi:peptide/nickel transport system ATP-binding protein
MRELGIALVLITHDLGIVARIAHRVAVMYAGEIVETASAEVLFRDPRHPYTQGLISCIPVPGRTRRGETLGVIPGVVPSLVGDLHGCPFRDRCPHARPQCALEPPHRVDAEGHAWRCILEAA